jgi:hypothetical protein
MQDHEEYLQAYVRRFLRLRAQAPTVPNEIVIEAMIKGLRPVSLGLLCLNCWGGLPEKRGQLLLLGWGPLILRF